MTHTKSYFLVLNLNSTAVFSPPFSLVSGMICMTVGLQAVFKKVYVLKMCGVGELQMV